MSRQKWLDTNLGDIDPLKYAGEGWTATEEIPRAADIVGNERLKHEVGREGDYYPETGRKRGKSQ